MSRLNSKLGIRNSEFAPKRKFEIVLLCLVLALLSGCAHRAVPPPTVRPVPPELTPTAPLPTPKTAPPEKPLEEGWTEKGLASWYGEPYHGRRTASGEIYDMHALTAAHRSLPFGSLVKVKRRDTGTDVTVRVNDRGPFVEGRIIDLSYAAARKIGLDVDGVAPVRLELVGREDAPKRKSGQAGRAEKCFWVQVGAFGDHGNALRAEDELERGGEQAVVLEGADHLWRVRLGPFESEKSANKACHSVSDAWPGAHVVPCGG